MTIVRRTVRRLERLEALDKVAKPLAGAVGRAVRPRVARTTWCLVTAVVADDVTFWHLVADRTVLAPEVRRYRPGQFCLPELPPLHAALDAQAGMYLSTAHPLLLSRGSG